MPWVFNNEYLKEKFSNNENQAIIIESFRNIGISPKDKFLILDLVERKVAFTLSGTIGSVEKKERSNTKNVFSISFSSINYLQEIAYLDDYAYSLDKIYRINYPIRHFQRQYVAITNDDYRTIIESKLDYRRTFMGKIVKCLPKEHRIGFLQYFISTDAATYTRRKNYQRAIHLLKKYLEENILVYGNLIIDISSLLPIMVDPSKIEHIAFYDENKNKTQLIKKQADLFNPLFSQENTNLWSDIEKLDDRGEELLFNKQRDWPIEI